MSQIELEGGKYTYINDEQGQRVLRYGEHWRGLAGDKFAYCLAAEIEALKQQALEMSPFVEVGKAMVELTTTVRGVDEWPAIPTLWQMCMEERDSLKQQVETANTMLNSCFSKELVLTQQVEQGKLDAVPEGWVLVPVEPTDEMELRGAESTNGKIEWGDSPDETPYELAADVYKAMIAATPKQEK